MKLRWNKIQLALTAALSLVLVSCSSMPPQPSVEDQRISIAPYHQFRVKGESIQNFGAKRTVQVFNDKGAGLATMITPDGYYLTAMHVIDGNQSVIFTDKDSGRPLIFKSFKKGKEIELDAQTVIAHEVRMVCAFPEIDLALVKSRAKLDKHFSIIRKRPASNDTVFSAANQFVNQTAAGMVYASEGLSTPASIRRQSPAHAWNVFSSAPLRQGDSGGPLFNDRGELVAINVSVAMRLDKTKSFHHSKSTMVQPDKLRRIISADRQKN